MLVPQTFNDGTDIPADVFAELRERAISMFGGLTVGSTSVGYWSDNGTVYCDIVTRYIVATADRAAVNEFAQHVARVCNQIAVYVAQTAADVQFIGQ